MRFHGQEIAVSPELRYLAADEAAANFLGRRPHGRVVPTEDRWMQILGLTLDLFDDAGRGTDAYEWLVTPHEEIGDRPPLVLLQQDRSQELLRLTRRHLGQIDRRAAA
ncbi:MAG: hypothetical protein AB7V58_16390 [Solirubrobacterales bacterium]